MVGIAQADNFAIFIRKIGYSVGLEKLLDRVADFGIAYAHAESFRETDWQSLLKKWKLTTNNISDVFAALGIVRFSNGDAIIEPMGEALGISAKLLPPSEYLVSTTYIVALAIIKADGDIFLNALQSEFDKDKLRNALISMVVNKREALYRIFGSVRDKEAIAKYVAIERQKTNRGGSSTGGLSSLTKGSPLDDKLKNFGLPKSIDIHHFDAPSDDYLKKIAVTRKGWAEALGLFDGHNLTHTGINFLGQFANKGYADQGTYFLWPTSFEAQVNRFDLRGLAPLNLPSTWDFQTTVFQAMGGAYIGNTPSKSEHDALIDDIRSIYKVYKNLSLNRSMIRNEISNYVIQCFLLGRSMSRQEQVPDWSKLIHVGSLSDSNIAIRRSQTIEYGISIR